MAKNITNVAVLANNLRVPLLGFGTWKLREPGKVSKAIRHALDAGYRHIDTAAAYENERAIGAAIRESGVAREELFITSKVWNDDIRRGYEGVLTAFNDSCAQLGSGYLDLYLLHWPIGGIDQEAWRGMEQLYSDGKVKAIGVSNYQKHHLEALLKTAQVIPMVNQIEFHPYLPQPELLAYLRQLGIVPEAWSPLMQGNVTNVPEIVAIASEIKKTPAQVILRWDVQHGVVTIPKSSNPDRIAENAAIFDFELTEGQMEVLDSLGRGKRFGPDPDNFGF